MKKKKNIHPRRDRQLELSSRTIIFETQFFFVLELLLFYLSWERAQELQQAVLSTIRDSHWLHNFWSPDICSLRLSFLSSFFYSSYLATRFHLFCLSAQHFCADWLPKIGDSSRGFKYWSPRTAACPMRGTSKHEESWASSRRNCKLWCSELLSTNITLSKGSLPLTRVLCSGQIKTSYGPGFLPSHFLRAVLSTRKPEDTFGAKVVARNWEQGGNNTIRKTDLLKVFCLLLSKFGSFL